MITIVKKDDGRFPGEFGESTKMSSLSVGQSYTIFDIYPFVQIRFLSLSPDGRDATIEMVSSTILSRNPTEMGTHHPTWFPTAFLTDSKTPTLEPVPTSAPTNTPTAVPTVTPTAVPTTSPTTLAPTANPTSEPTPVPTPEPTPEPTVFDDVDIDTSAPTMSPTNKCPKDSKDIIYTNNTTCKKLKKKSKKQIKKLCKKKFVVTGKKVKDSCPTTCGKKSGVGKCKYLYN